MHAYYIYMWINLCIYMYIYACVYVHICTYFWCSARVPRDLLAGKKGLHGPKGLRVRYGSGDFNTTLSI